MTSRALTITVPIGVAVATRFRNQAELWAGTATTTRVCSEEGCEGAALFKKGHYFVGTRRVRVWVCKDHQVGNPNQVLPLPESIRIAEEAERKHQEAVELRYRWVDGRPRDSVSVKTLASTGHGPAIRGDRVAAFRWEPTPKKRGKK